MTRAQCNKAREGEDHHNGIDANIYRAITIGYASRSSKFVLFCSVCVDIFGIYSIALSQSKNIERKQITAYSFSNALKLEKITRNIFSFVDQAISTL